MSSISAATGASARDLRVDFFRGVALWVIFWDHGLILGRVEFAPFYCMPAFTMFSDAAELFVFLSGFVFGLVYTKTLLQDGMKACCKKAAYRVWQIYRAHVLTLLACFAVCWLYFTHYGFILLEVDTLMLEPVKLLALGTVLYYLPFGFDILPLYIVLIGMMPFLLFVYRSRPKLAVSISIALYIVPQFFPEIGIPRYRPAFGSDGTWFFNILAWQLLFFIGMALGANRRLGRTIPIPRKRGLIALAAIFIVISPVLKLGGVLLHLDSAEVIRLVKAGEMYERLDDVVGVTEEEIYAGAVPHIGFPWSDKRFLEPVRLLHFFSAVYLVIVLLPPNLAFWRGRIAAPLRLCGRHSLEVFALSILLNFAMGTSLQVFGGGTIAFFLLSLLGFAVLTLAAHQLERRKQRVTHQVLQRTPAGDTDS